MLGETFRFLALAILFTIALFGAAVLLVGCESARLVTLHTFEAKWGSRFK